MFLPTRPRRFTVSLPVELMLLACGLVWVALGNRAFFAAALQGRETADASAWTFGGALAVGLVALHFLLLAPLANRYTVKPLLALLLVATAFATHFMQQFGVYLDPSMLRNMLRTDVQEARELFSWVMLPRLLLYAGLPLLLLWRVEPKRWRWPRSLAVRLLSMGLALLVLVAAVLSMYQPLASMMRNQRDMRYLITPANYLWSLSSVLASEVRGQAGPRKAIGLDATLGPTWAARQRPAVLVIVVGETARAANWGLNAHARQTTPQLAALSALAAKTAMAEHGPIINFPDAHSCGTNTETSVPCMFAPVGRRDYDEATIRGSQSLLHVLARAGVGVNWRDNQSGCKGVCDGLPSQSMLEINPPGLCTDGRCLDEGLLHGLPELLRQARGPQVLVLHQLGNHGPSYFRRYPSAFARFQPACEKDDLRSCSVEQIVNAYDNALLYTDEVLARLIEQLQAQQADVDSAVVYVSDHGESLGENNLFLHGLPYAIAPDVQTHVPMLMWFSKGFAKELGLNLDCLQQRARQKVAHDHLFHTTLGLLDVRTSLYDKAWDLSLACRRAP